MKQTMNRPLLVACGTVMMVLVGTMNAWSVFRLELANAFPAFLPSQLSLCFSINICTFCLGGFFGGRLSGRLNRMWVLRLAALLIALGYLGMSGMAAVSEPGALMLLLLTYGVLAGLGVGIAYNVVVAGITRWTQERLGLVSGILLMGFGLGSIVMGVGAQKLVPALGILGVFRVYGILIFALLCAGSFLLKPSPASVSAVGAVATDEPSVTPGQMVRKPSFWLYFLWNIVCSSSGLLVINSSSSIAVAYGCAAALGLIVSVTGGVGRPFVGLLMDHVSQFKGLTLMNGILILAGVCLVVTGNTESPALLVAGLILVGIVYGGGVTISAKVIRSLYGPRHYAVNFSISNFCAIPASFIGPYVSGLLQDRSGGSYGSTFTMLLVFSLVSLALNLALQAVVKHERTAAKP